MGLSISQTKHNQMVKKIHKQKKAKRQQLASKTIQNFSTPTPIKNNQFNISQTHFNQNSETYQLGLQSKIGFRQNSQDKILIKDNLDKQKYSQNKINLHKIEETQQILPIQSNVKQKRRASVSSLTSLKKIEQIRTKESFQNYDWNIPSQHSILSFKNLNNSMLGMKSIILSNKFAEEFEHISEHISEWNNKNNRRRIMKELLAQKTVSGKQGFKLSALCKNQDCTID